MASRQVQDPGSERDGTVVVEFRDRIFQCPNHILFVSQICSSRAYISTFFSSISMEDNRINMQLIHLTFGGDMTRLVSKPTWVSLEASQ